MAKDDEFILYTVTVFRRAKDEFSQKCREEKCVRRHAIFFEYAQLTAKRFTVRDFKYDSTAAEKQRAELESLEHAERDQWVCALALPMSACVFTGHAQAELLRLSRINFSEGLQILIHLKVVRAFMECVLRYGLPASYFSAVVQVRSLTLSSHSDPIRD